MQIVSLLRLTYKSLRVAPNAGVFCSPYRCPSVESVAVVRFIMLVSLTQLTPVCARFYDTLTLIIPCALQHLHFALLIECINKTILVFYTTLFLICYLRLYSKIICNVLIVALNSNKYRILFKQVFMCLKFINIGSNRGTSLFASLFCFVLLDWIRLSYLSMLVHNGQL